MWCWIGEAKHTQNTWHIVVYHYPMCKNNDKVTARTQIPPSTLHSELWWAELWCEALPEKVKIIMPEVNKTQKSEILLFSEFTPTQWDAQRRHSCSCLVPIQVWDISITSTASLIQIPCMRIVAVHKYIHGVMKI